MPGWERSVVFVDAGLAHDKDNSVMVPGRGQVHRRLFDEPPVPSLAWMLHGALGRRAMLRRLKGRKLAGLLELCRLVAVEPPGFRNAARVARLGRRAPEHVPIGDPVRRLVPAGHPVVLGAEYAIERTAGDVEALAVVGRDRLLDQSVHRR